MPQLDFRHELACGGRRLHVELFVEHLVKIVICPQRRTDLAVLRRQTHHGSAGSLVRWLDHQHCLGKEPPLGPWQSPICVTLFKPSDQLLLDPGARRNDPFLERRADIIVA